MPPPATATRSAARPTLRRASRARHLLRPRSALVPGTVVVALLVCLSRWGSYLGVPSRSVYLADVGLVAVLVWLLACRRSDVRGTRLPRSLAWPLLAFLGWSGIRFLTWSRSPDLDTLRDLAPYAYGAVALLAAVPVSAGAWRSTERWLGGALLLHAGWVTVAVLAPSLPQRTPLLGGQIHVLELRPDFDGAMCAVLAALALRACGRRGPYRLRMAALGVAAWSSFLVLEMGSRASLLALLAIGPIVVEQIVHGPRSIPRRWLVLGLVVALGLAAAVVPQTSTYQRVVGVTDPNNLAGGTASARQAVYAEVLDYLHDDPGRTAFGVGFGPDFLELSGGASHYEGTTYTGVRAPHNYLLNTYARLGLIGLALLLWLVSVAAWTAWRALRDRSSLSLMLAGLLTAIFVTSQVGVILEAPFGAIPFWWAVGALAVRARQVGPSRTVLEDASVPPVAAQRPTGRTAAIEPTQLADGSCTPSGLGWPGPVASVHGPTLLGWPTEAATPGRD